LAKDGTLFLDEITELTPECQAKLLRLLEEREFYPVGGLRKISTKARFICATNQDIKDKVRIGLFRQDLYFRLNTGHITIPPLRNRRQEISSLAEMFLRETAREKKKQFSSIAPEANKILESYPWPGNVRELKNAMERIVLIWDEKVVKVKHLDFIYQTINSGNHSYKVQEELTPNGFNLPEINFNLKEWNLDIVKKALLKHIGNKSATAEYLCLSRKELYTYLRRF